MAKTIKPPGIGTNKNLYKIFGPHPVLTEGATVTGTKKSTAHHARLLAKKPTLSQKEFQDQFLIRTNDGSFFFKISHPDSLFKRGRTVNQQVLKQILSNSKLASQYYSWRDAFAKVASDHDINQVEWLGKRDQDDLREIIERDEEHAVTAYEQKNKLETNKAHEKFVQAALGFFHKNSGTKEKLLEDLGVKSLTADQKSWLIGALCDNYLFGANHDGAKVLKKHPDYHGFAEKFNILSEIPNNPQKTCYASAVISDLTSKSSSSSTITTLKGAQGQYNRAPLDTDKDKVVTETDVKSRFENIIADIDQHISKDGTYFLLKNPSNSNESLTPQEALGTRLSLAKKQERNSLEDMLIATNYLIEAYKICQIFLPKQTEQLQDVKDLSIDNIWSILQSQTSNPQKNPS
jgi:hypothetical protein